MSRDLQTTFRGYAPDERGAHKPPELVFEVAAPAGLAVKPLGFLGRFWALHWKKKLTLAALLFNAYVFASMISGDWLVTIAFNALR